MKLKKRADEDATTKIYSDEARSAFRHRQIALALKRRISQTSFILGRYLCEIEDRRLHKVLGFESYRTFLAAPVESGGLDLAPHTANLAQSLYRHYILKLGLKAYSKDLQGIDRHKLRIIRPITNRENVKDWLNKARALSREDLKIVVKQVKGRIDEKLDAETEEEREIEILVKRYTRLSNKGKERLLDRISGLKERK
ncbi:MAG TPA: hypothetical protein EYP21_08665 [Syntrophaceae bacterium]|nr:hypothetical protein [Syntrophaceae bacterium]